MAFDDRILGVLQSESSPKDKGKGKRKRTNQHVRSPTVEQPVPRLQRTFVGGAS